MHSQHRILGALKLAPMSKQQLQTCLSLHRCTVDESVRALELRNKVIRRQLHIHRRGCFGPIPHVFELAQACKQQTIEGEIP